MAIMLAGGTGVRVGGRIPKQFIEVQGKPIIAWTLDNFQNNPNIDAIEIVCHHDWMDVARNIVKEYGYTKVHWLCDGGSTYQESVCNGVFNLRGKLKADDIALIVFSTSPILPQEDVNDSIHVAMEHGNGIASADIDLCTCIKDDELSSSNPILRETLKGFASPWSFRFGELLDAHEEAIRCGLFDKIEPHTTSLYFELGKRIWFSQSTSPQIKITHRADIDMFEGWLLIQQAGKNN